MLVVMPRAAIAAAEGATSNVRTNPPNTLMSATPGRPRSAGRIVQSTRLRICCGYSVSDSMVNISISPSGVTIGARPPVGAGRQLIAQVLQPLVDLRARPENVGAIGEFEASSAPTE